MKYFFLLFIVHFSAVAQPVDSSIEVRLGLMQHVEKSQASGLVLIQSVMNHSNKDVYIPKFSFYKINYYKKTDTAGWKEIDLVTEDFYKPFDEKEATPPGAFSGHSFTPPWRLSNIPDYLGASSHAVVQKQDSIWSAYCKLSGTNPKLKWLIFPFCLKAGEEIKIYKAYNIDYLAQEPGEYKIGFNLEDRYASGRTPEYFDSMTIKPPGNIFSYHFYIPPTIVSNTLYYTFTEKPVKGNLKIPKKYQPAPVK